MWDSSLAADSTFRLFGWAGLWYYASGLFMTNTFKYTTSTEGGGVR